MIKILGLIMIITSTSGIGFLYANEIKKHIDNQENLIRILNFLMNTMRFKNSILADSLMSAAEYSNSIYGDLFKAVAIESQKGKGVKFSCIWNECISKYKHSITLSKVEMNYLEALGENLGVFDKEMQISSIQMLITKIQSEMQILKENSASNIKLYRSLGILSGLFIITLLM